MSDNRLKKIKILHISQPTYGGVAEYIKLFMKFNDNVNYDFTLACPNENKLLQYAKEHGKKTYQVNIDKDINLIRDIKAFYDICKIIKKDKPDIIHLHSTKAGILGKIAGAIYNVPTIYNAHGWSFTMNISNTKRKVYSIIEKATSRFCTHIVNISEYEQQIALDYRIKDKKSMSVIYNGIDINMYKRDIEKAKMIRKSLNINNDSIVIGMVARLAEQKNPILFLDIAKRMLKENEKIKFVLIGDGELRNDVEKYIEENSMNDSIIITGWVDNINEYINIFDIGLLTSRWEGFGLAIVEYMANEIPVVASNVGGIVNIITNNVNGYLVDDGEIEEYIKNINKLLKNPQKRYECINNGLKIARERFSINRVIEEHYNLYDKIIKDHEL